MEYLAYSNPIFNQPIAPYSRGEREQAKVGKVGVLVRVFGRNCASGSDRLFFPVHGCRVSTGIGTEQSQWPPIRNSSKHR